MAVGVLDHIYYWTADMDAAVDFYGDVVGLVLVRREGSTWAEFDAGPIRFALHGGTADVVRYAVLHGHIHPHGVPRPDRVLGSTRVINVVPHKVLEISGVRDET